MKKVKPITFPPYVKIGAHKFKISLHDRLLDNLSGYIEYSDDTIQLGILKGDKEGKKTDLNIMQTLLHETTHAIVTTWNIREQKCSNEDVIDTLAEGLLDVLLNSPYLLESLMELRERQ